MWILFSTLSVLSLFAGWVMAPKKPQKAATLACFSLALVALTLLMIFKLVYDWVNAGDFSALMDVIPSSFGFLVAYVLLLILGNMWTLMRMRK